MNDWDRDNLEFFLSCNWAEFNEVAESLNEIEDLEYAINLIKRGISELTVELLNESDEIENVDDAKTELDKIMKMK